MITREYCRVMSRYNQWQNASLYDAAGAIGEGARELDRGAFFGSIRRTLSHLLWGDTIWMSRFDGWEAPTVGIPGSADWVADWEALSALRTDADRRIIEWTDTLADANLAGELTWYSGALGREVSRPLSLCVAHFFNHQTHHRGQVHAMLTSAGARLDATDLFAMPEQFRPD